ncbi:MAG: LysM peptidoglycan-binding domain-containing protein [Betaproteobacteria bacterium]|jgi:hypothetical protein
MDYWVQAGDSLWKIAERFYGRGSQWPQLARLNWMDPHRLTPLLVGQRLTIDYPGGPLPSRGEPVAPAFRDMARPFEVDSPAIIPVVPYVFVLADEIDPFRRKVVRRVLVDPVLTAEAAKNLGRPLRVFPNPERFGFIPSDPNSPLSMGRHAKGMKPSSFVSASDRILRGSPRILGEPFWIDLGKLSPGAKVFETSEILADLDRIAAKTATAGGKVDIEAKRQLVLADREVLIKGAVPPQAVKGAAAMGATRLLQGVQIVGFAMTAVNLGHAGEQSIRTHSVRPIAAETVRQAGGWASAWAGMKLGVATGAVLGFSTGPGAVITAGVGGFVGGVAGYFAFDWVADHISAD